MSSKRCIEAINQIAIAVPAILANRIDLIPVGMAIFFLIWVIILPFVIPFRVLFSSEI